MNRMRGCLRVVRLPLFLALAVSMLGQGENEPYFALSSFKTFGSGEKPTVSFNGWNVDTLEFRVYRVNDPVKFFQQLDQAHEFGGRASRPAAERTPLEKVHFWKRSLRASIRRELRGQFTEPPHDHVASFLPTREAPKPQPPATTPAPPATMYAEAPVLNPQQLVLTFQHPVQHVNRWDREDVKIPVTDKGVYLVEAVNHELRAYTILMVSDLVMVSKAGQDKVLNFAIDRNTGQPVRDLPVVALRKGDVVGTAKTDRDGVAELPSPHQELFAELTVLARRGQDVAVNAIEFTPRDSWEGYIYTDRPVYRPGHTVHFRAILRVRTANGHDVPAGQKVSFEIQDPDQKPAYQKVLTVSGNGTVHDDLTLAQGAALGNYFMRITPEKSTGEFGDQASGFFEVDAYKKPEYEVRVTPAKSRVLQGDKVQATIDARYFFGEPVANAKVKYSVYRNRYWFPLWYDPDEEPDQQDADAQGNDYGGDQLTDQEGQLDADGKLAIEIPTQAAEGGHDVVLRIEARVTDQGNREITGAGRVIATYGAFVLNAMPERYIYEPGEKATWQIEARDYDNNPVRRKVHIELMKWVWTGRIETPVAATDVDLDQTGSGKASFTIPEGGTYKLRVSAESAQGRTVTSEAYVWVEGGAGGWGVSRGAIQIVPDKKTYKPGDTAKLLVVAGQPNTAVYLTVEGRDLGEHKVIRSTGATVAFEVPIRAEFEPGITVSATFIRDGVASSGTKYVRVPPLEHQINVKLSTDKPQYLPGESAKYALDVTDQNGRPVPKAEFSLGVVDEAIYGVRPDTTPNITNFFFGRDYDHINTQNSLQFFFSGSAGKRKMQLAELRPRGRLAQLKPERLVQPKVRKAFPDTAFWASELTTDADGHAIAKVDFPDSLTTWRATARGVTATTSVGSATLKTVVRKNLILRLVTPRFLVEGDEVTISALVHNYLTTEKKARVSLEGTGVSFIAGSTQDVTIPSRGEVKIDWRVKPLSARMATITGKALTDEESDALELDLPIDLPGIELSSSKGGAVAAGASTQFDLAFPPNALAGSRGLSVRVSPSVAGSLFGALDYLTSFPYGCVEQTMSSFLPDIVVKDAVRTLGLKTVLNEVSLQEKINAGLDRLYGFQHQDGGWGWWETDESHPFMTAYVVAGLVQARNAGTRVDDVRISRGVQWIKQDLARDSKLNADTRAYLLYALTVAGDKDAAGLSAMYERRSDLSAYGMAMLGTALENVDDKRAGELANALEKSASEDGEQAWWTATRDPLLDFDVDATPEATAFVTRFLSHEKKDSAVLPKAAYWLVSHRNQGYWWESTKQTAMVIYGLIDYLKTSHELMPRMTVNVFVNDKQVMTKRFDDVSVMNPPELTLPEGSLQPEMNHIRITTSGEGRLYYGARADYHALEVPAVSDSAAGPKLTRDYFRLVPVKVGDKIEYDTTPLDGPVAVGDTIAVRLALSGSPEKYMLLEDPIPAGTEFIERDDKYALRAAPPWWRWNFDRREMHDDHMAIFQQYTRAAGEEYFYLLKVVNPGVFQINPAKASPMYKTGVMAFTAGGRLEVK